MKDTSQQQLINAFRSNDSSLLQSFYASNYHKSEAYILKNNGNKDHAKDTYQDAFIAVWKNIKTNKFEPKNENALSGYLYQIVKHKWMDYLRSSAYKKSTSLTDFKVIREDDSIYDTAYDRKIETVKTVFKTLGEPCQSLLSSFYYTKLSLREIATQLNIGEASARNKKYRCMEKLKALVLASKP